VVDNFNNIKRQLQTLGNSLESKDQKAQELISELTSQIES
jgi:hypothetical protein